jgi:xylulokinase
MSLLGIDVGTSGCKAGVFSETGRLIALAYEEYDVQRPAAGWAELDARQVWAQVQRTIRTAVARVADDPIRALSVSSMGEAVVPVAADRRILGPSLLNFDTRGNEYLPGWRAALSNERLYRINGNTLGDQYGLTKLQWLRQHQPDLYERTHKFLLWGSFVAFMLGAEPLVDYSLANRTLLFDLDRRDWSDELLALAGLDRDRLPAAAPSGTVIGRVSRQAAGELGLPAGASIVAGGHDQCINGVGCGAIAPGRAMYGMGTYICMMPVFDRRPEPDVMIARGLNTEHHAAPGRFVSFIYNHGGSILKWFRDAFAATDRRLAAESGRDIYADLIAELPAAPSRVIALPHWGPTGPPEFVSDSSGVLAGLRLETTRGDILKGILEGVTFYERACLESLPAAGIASPDVPGIEINALAAVGGGSKADAWLQMTADILGRPTMRPAIAEAGVLGAAIVAGTGCGVFPSLAAGVETMVRPDRVFEPNPTIQRLYDERFEKYRRLWPLMRDYLRDLGQQES